MSQPRILFSDLTAITFTSPDGTIVDYEATHLNDYAPNGRWVAGATTTPSLNITFAVPTTCDSLIIGQHNFDSVVNTGDIILQASSTSDFSAGVTDVLFIVAPNNYTPYYGSFTPTTSRYWRILYAATLFTNPYIGNLFLDSMFSFPFTYLWGYKKDNKQYSTIQKINLFGSHLNSQAVGGRYIHELDFKLLNDATRTYFTDLIKKTRGCLRPFFFLDHDDSIKYLLFAEDYNPVSVERYNLNDIIGIQMKSVTTADVVSSATLPTIYTLYDNEIVTSVT